MTKPNVRLFAYGTLRNRDLVSGVIGRKWLGSYRDALLPGYRLIDTNPRFIVPDSEEFVEGVLLSRLLPEDFIGLDRYEGVGSGLYQRKLVKILPANSVEEIDAWVYVQGSRIRPQIRTISRIGPQDRKPTEHVCPATELLCQIQTQLETYRSMGRAECPFCGSGPGLRPHREECLMSKTNSLVNRAYTRG